ncbi:hypothetical protein RHGRI_010892 [Rhododendron griersonianum]|uniref:Uncharacterized protein n=1 Tax=Rhododendron griersonianum TaxID=479676 RepID=A0AAV6KKP0_9ERIC|nr:hypothetical protein RHGRI_010892 [Rhododendron griersonianum]
MASRLLCHQARQGIDSGKAIKAKAWQTNCQSPGKVMQCSRHAKTKSGQGMTHGMPKQGDAKAWQADCLSPGKAMQCSRHAKTKVGQGMAKPIACHRERQCNAHGMPRPRVAKAWQADCLSPGKAMHWPRHDSRHAKTRGGQGMASRLLSPGKECNAHGIPRPRVAKA